MKNKLGSILITGLGLLLLVYSAARSLDFISLTLPADKQILAFFGLAALDGGLIFWLISFMYGSHGWQRPISLLMVILDFFGAVAMFTLDTLLATGQSGMTAQLGQGEIQTAVLSLSIIIAANVGATVLHHILDPENLRRMAEEEAKDRIESLALKEINASAASLAHQLAPQIGRAWRDQTEANYQNIIHRRAPKALPENAAPEMTIMAQETTRSIAMPETQQALPELTVTLPETGEVPETANPTRPAPKRRIRKVVG